MNAALPLAVSNLGKRFDAKTVLDNVSLEVPPGDVLGLLGENGSGKTTLLKTCLGLLKATSGEARIFGEPAWELSADVKGRIGYVPQEVVSYPWMRLRQVIQYTSVFYPDWNHSFADTLCRRWRLPLEERVGALSTGQLQTLGIVLALGHQPELLILDEPVASLDPAARREFLQTLLDVIEDPRRTVVFSTHITSDLERAANRLAILRGTSLVFYGGLDELKESVKRLRITAPHDLPASFAVPGALRCEVAGGAATVSVADFSERLVDDVRRTWDANVSVVDLNLEEIFVEMHRTNGEAC